MKRLLLLTLTTLSAFIICGCSDNRPELNVYTWSDYIDDGLVKEFEDKYNCKVVIDTFDSNEAMYAKIKAGASGYDIIMPTSYMAEVMYKEKLIEKLDLSKISNANYIDKLYLQKLAFDKTMEYSIPYMLGYTCIAYNKERVMKPGNSWSIFSRKDLNGRMTLLNDTRETLGAALLYKGYSINTTNQKELDIAVKQVNKWKKHIAKFDNEVYKIGLTSGEFWVVQGYSGDILQAIQERPNIAIVIPKEGVSISCDDLVIPTSSDNKELAYKFINFIIEPKNAAKNMEYTQFFAPVPDAMKFVKELDLSLIFPTELYDRGQLIKDLGDDNRKYYEAWSRVKSD
jgi:spermidine/putrescine transport system substrate-binding protein